MRPLAVRSVSVVVATTLPSLRFLPVLVMSVLTPRLFVVLAVAIVLAGLLPVFPDATIVNDFGAIFLLDDLPRRRWGWRQVLHGLMVMVNGVWDLDFNRDLDRDLYGHFDGHLDPALSLAIDGIRHGNDPFPFDVDLSGVMVVTAVRARATPTAALLRLDIDTDHLNLGLWLDDWRWWRRRGKREDNWWWRRRRCWFAGRLINRLRLRGHICRDAATDGRDIRVWRREVEAALGATILFGDCMDVLAGLVGVSV
jgi:hypothetical protein